MEDIVYVIITGHNQEAKCDVANALIHQRDYFRPFSCRKNLKVNSRKTLDGRQLCIVTTPSLNTPSWTREEKRFKTFKSKIFLYIKDNDCVDSDDQWSIKTLEKRFKEPGRQTVLVVGYNLRNRAVSDTTVAETSDQSVDSLPSESSASCPIFHFNKQDSFELKTQRATSIIGKIKKLLRLRTTVPTPEGRMDVDDRRLSQAARNTSNLRLESDVDDAILDTVKVTEGSSHNEEEEFRNIPLPQLEDDDRKLFRKTLTIGKARSNHVRVNVVGNQSAGKTTLVQRLQDIETKCPNPNQKSTEGIDISQVTTRCTERNGQRFWKSKSSESETSDCNPFMRPGSDQEIEGFEKELNLQRMAFALKHAENQTQKLQTTAEMVSELEAGSEEFGESGEVQTSVQYKEQFNIQQKENYLQKVKRWRENSHEEFMYISYWDFAGQATYYSTHQAFMATSAVYLLVIDLNLDLDKSLDEKDRFNMGILKQYTVEETVKFWISSIKAYTRDEKDGNAPFIVVGTHKDQVTEDQISNTFSRLRKVMRNITAVEFVAIDNTLPLDSDESLKALRNKILDLGLGVIDEEIPAQWIDLENILLQHKCQAKGLIDFTGIEELDATLDMPMKDPDRIKAFLDHQHSRGWLLHFCHMDLKDIIILDPILLANFFNTLLRARPDYRLQSSSENKDGIIHQDFIQEAAAKEFNIRDSAPEVQTLTNLLIHLHIIHKYKNGDCYFVPCLLPHRDKENLKNSHHLEKSPALKLSFKDAFVPPAFYHLLTGALLEHPNISIKKEWLFNLYACFIFQRDTLRLETYWRECSVFFELKNFSQVNKIVGPETNKTLELISILEERVEHVLSVFRQKNTKYKLNIECPGHKGSFVDMKEVRKKGEVMCTDKEMHAVSWDKICENCPIPRNKFDGALLAEDKPTEHKIGRLARQLGRENARSLTSKLKLENGNVIADRMIQDYGKSVELQLMHILIIWMNLNPDKPLKYLLEKLSKRGDYEFGSLAHTITIEVPQADWSGKVYVIITGHNQEAKCDVGNALIHQRDHFRPFSCRKNIKVISRNTMFGRQLCIVTTPTLNTPAWTHGEKRIEKFNSKVFLYIKDNDCVDSDDQWSIKMLETRFGEPGRQSVLLVRYNMRNRALSEPTAAETNDLSTDAVPIEDSLSCPIIHFNKRDSFQLKTQTASRIMDAVKKVLESPTVIPKSVGAMSVDARRPAKDALNASSISLESECDVSLLDTVKMKRGYSQDGEDFKSIPLPELEDDDWKLFRKTLKVGKARTNHVRVNVVGNQSAGKTTLIQRLQFAETTCPNQDQKSTEGLEIRQVTTRCTEKDGQRCWTTKSSGFDKELNLQRMAFALQHAENQTDPSETLQKTAEIVSEIELGSEECDESEAVQKSVQYGEQINIQQKERYLQRVKRWRENSQEEFMYISYWDFAGQATYYSTHQAFMAPSAVYLLVIDLNLDLDKPLVDKMRFNTGILKQYTVEETVKFWISSIKAYTRDEKDGHAPFIVVGTHKDQVTEDQVINTFSRLRKVMRNITPVEFVAIDNTLPLDSDESLQALRNKILDLGLGVIDEEIPAQWIDLENNLLLQKDTGKGIVTFKDIEELDANSDMPMKDSGRIEAFLDHQHSRGWLLHFCHMDLKDIIILNPMLLANFFNTLLRDRPDYRLPSSSENKDGIIHQHFIQDAAATEFNIRRNSPEVQALTSLLIQLHIIHRYKDDCRYFVPCLLPHKDDDDLKSSRHYEKSPVLKLSFKDAFVPPAFYHLLVGALIERPEIRLYKKGEKVWIYNLYTCFTFQRDTLWLETYWSECSVFFELTNYSFTQKIVESGTNKTLELITILEQRVEHVLSVFRQENTKYKLEIECPQHKDSFVDMKKVRKSGEVMCTDKEEIHAVKWEEICKTSQETIKTDEVLLFDGGEKPSHRGLGRLARQLSHESALSMTSKLKLRNVVADRAMADFSHSVDMQRLHILSTWANANPEKPLKYLLKRFTRTGDYSTEALVTHLSENLESTACHDEEFLQFESQLADQKALSLISDCIGSEYAFLMLELGLTIPQIERCRLEINDVRERVYVLLEHWRACNDLDECRATTSKILEAAKYLGMNYSEMVRKLKTYASSG